MRMRRHLWATACRSSGRYVMHSTNAAGRYSIHTCTYLSTTVSPPHFMAPSLPVTGQRSGCLLGLLVCSLILPVVPAHQPGDIMIALHGRCSSLTMTTVVFKTTLLALVPQICLLPPMLS